MRSDLHVVCSNSQGQTTTVEKAFQFCLYLLRASDEAFEVFLSSLQKVGQKHIADELFRVKDEGSVNAIDIDNPNMIHFLLTSHSF